MAMTIEEQQVVECAIRAVDAGCEWCDARDAADDMRGHGMRMRLALGLADHRAAAEKAEADLALMDAVDALGVARVSLEDADLILEERERRLTAALTAVAAERARCAAVCREVACFYDSGDVGSVVALACADEIERGT